MPINATEQAAARGRDLSGVAMVVSGHIHHFASFAFEGNRPPQLIVGTGGDVGEAGDSPEVPRRRGEPRRHGRARGSASTATASWCWIATGAGWDGTFYDVHDRPIAVCRVAGRKLACHAAGT